MTHGSLVWGVILAMMPLGTSIRADNVGAAGAR